MFEKQSKKLLSAKTKEPTSCKKLLEKIFKTLANEEKCITFAPAFKHRSYHLLIKINKKTKEKFVGIDKTIYLSNPDFLKTKCLKNKFKNNFKKTC